MRMFVLSGSLILAALCLLSAGCGGKLRTRGKVMKDGKPLLPEGKDSVRVTFVPILPDGKPPTDHYHAIYDRDSGTFTAAGKDKKGMPPGKYRVAIFYMKNKKDLFNGRFDEENSPFVFDVDSSTKDLVIDLDTMPAPKG
jgi:hypothetical protein